MSLTILSVAYPHAPVHAGTAGGAEQILLQIDSALVQSGHRSLVLASEGSRIAGELLPVESYPGLLSPEARFNTQLRYRRMIGKAIDKHRVDLVHMHGIDAFEMLPPEGLPTVISLHLPASWYPAAIFNPSRPRTYLLPVSASQRRDCPGSFSLLDPIENGVPVGELDGLDLKREDFGLVLGRICPEKGIELAMDAAASAGIPLVIAGEVFAYPEHQGYFETVISPRLNGRCRFIGPVNFEQKRDLMSRAACVLIPSRVPETSSLVAREAAACGAPVIAFRVGALPDTVVEGMTGYLVNTVEEMAQVIGRTQEISSAVCREVARERFGLERMMAELFALYKRLV